MSFWISALCLCAVIHLSLAFDSERCDCKKLNILKNRNLVHKQCNNFANNNVVIQLSCRQGFPEFYGNSTEAECLNGEWKIPNSFCLPESCSLKNHLTLTHGRVSFYFQKRPISFRSPAEHLKHGGKGIFKCDIGYELFVNNDYYDSIYYEVSCANGMWSAFAPFCTPARCYCSNLVHHDFENKGLISTCEDLLQHGEFITFQCKEGYSGFKGVRSAECVYGNWSVEIPQCKAPCLLGQYAFIDKGLVHYIDETGTSVRLSKNSTEKLEHDTQLIFSCNKKYQLNLHNEPIFNESYHITCDNGKWNSLPPTCQRSKGGCIIPPEMNGNLFKEINSEPVPLINATSVEDNTVLIVHCNKRYEIRIGDDAIDKEEFWCEAGEWRSPITPCQIKTRCLKPEIPDAESIVYRKSRHHSWQILGEDRFLNQDAITRVLCSYFDENGKLMYEFHYAECHEGLWVKITNHKEELPPFSCKSKTQTTTPDTIVTPTTPAPIKTCDFETRVGVLAVHDNTPLTNSAMENGSTIFFFCFNGSQWIKQGSSVCDNGYWTTDPPDCEDWQKEICEKYGLIPRVTTDPTIYTTKGVVEERTEMTSIIEITSKPEVEKKECLYERQDNVLAFYEGNLLKRNEWFPSETVLHFRCRDLGLFVFEGRSSIRCINGFWNNIFPRCQRLTPRSRMDPPVVTYSVISSPVKIDTVGTLLLNAGGTLTLNCLFYAKYGNPTWTFHNKKNNVEDLGFLYVWNAEKDSLSIVLSELTRDDTGIYECQIPDQRKSNYIKVQIVG